MSLSAEVRKKSIMEKIERIGSVRVNTLAEQFSVSGETIRRDLDKLEREGMLKKVYGGAVKSKVTSELSRDMKAMINKQEKESICKSAASLVEDGDVVLIGHGTTLEEIVTYLQDKENITIITSSIPVLQKALGNIKGKLIFLGGEVEQPQKFTGGMLSHMMLNQLRANKAFIAAGGVSLYDGITDYDLHGSHMSKNMMSRADESIVLADHTKFGKATFAHICSLSEVDMLITSNKCPKDWQDMMKEENIELLLTEM